MATSNNYTPTAADAAEAMETVRSSRNTGGLFGLIAGAGLGWWTYVAATAATTSPVAGSVIGALTAAVGGPVVAIGAAVLVGAAVLWAGKSIGKAIGFNKANAMLEDRAEQVKMSKSPSVSQEQSRGQEQSGPEAATTIPAPTNERSIRSGDAGQAYEPAMPQQESVAEQQSPNFLARELERAKLRQESLAQASNQGRTI